MLLIESSSYDMAAWIDANRLYRVTSYAILDWPN